MATTTSSNNNNLTNWKDGEPVAYISNSNVTTANSLNNLTFWKDGQPVNFIANPLSAQQQTDFFLSLGL